MKALVLLVTLLVSLDASGARPEKWWDAYDRGVKAVLAGSHAAAVQALEHAVAEMPKESATARARNETFVYVPHFWLGIARFNLGDIEGASREFELSQKQGAVQNTRYYADLRSWLSRVQAQKEKSSEGAAAEGRNEANAAIKKAMSAQMEAVGGGGDRSESYRAGQRKLEEARAVSAKAGSDVREYRRAAGLANDARVLFSTALDDANRQKAARAAGTKVPPLSRTVSASPTAIDSSVGKTPASSLQTSQGPPKGAGPLAATVDPPSVSAAVADARVILQQYRRRLSSAASKHRQDSRFREWSSSAMREVNAWQESLEGPIDDDAASSLGTAITRRDRELGLRVTELEQAALTIRNDARAALEGAWRAYAAGELERADELLTGIVEATGSAEAYLLRACGRYTQAVLHSSRLDAAESDFREALKRNRKLRLDSKMFSPKLVAYFETIRRK